MSLTLGMAALFLVLTEQSTTFLNIFLLTRQAQRRELTNFVNFRFDGGRSGADVLGSKGTRETYDEKNWWFLPESDFIRFGLGFRVIGEAG